MTHMSIDRNTSRHPFWRPVWRFTSGISLALAALLVTVAAVNPEAFAGWLGKLVRESGETGDTVMPVARNSLGKLAAAAAHVKTLPPEGDRIAVAVRASPEGHWTFVNRDGDVYTAGTPGELARAVPMLVPEAASSAPEKLAFYLSEDTVFERAALLKQLPEGARLHIVSGEKSFRLLRRTNGDKPVFSAEVRPHVEVVLTEAVLFRELLWQLARPLEPRTLRIVALETGAPRTLLSARRFDPKTRTAAIDALDPDRLVTAIPGGSQQTLLLTARRDGDVFVFAPSSGPERRVPVRELVTTAEAADVNLIVLHAPSAQQPGGRNWLWQRIDVDGLDTALQRATFADFLDSLAESHGSLAVTGSRRGETTVMLLVIPSESEGIMGGFGSWVSDMTGSVTGTVTTTTLEAYLRTEERQRELDHRIVPYVPSTIQFLYIANLLAGLMGLSVALAWWRRLWPPEQRSAYRGTAGFAMAWLVRLAVFAVLFLPLVGLPALIATGVLQALSWIMLAWHAILSLVRMGRRKPSETGTDSA